MFATFSKCQPKQGSKQLKGEKGSSLSTTSGISECLWPCAKPSWELPNSQASGSLQEVSLRVTTSLSQARSESRTFPGTAWPCCPCLGGKCTRLLSSFRCLSHGAGRAAVHQDEFWRLLFHPFDCTHAETLHYSFSGCDTSHVPIFAIR